MSDGIEGSSQLSGYSSEQLLQQTLASCDDVVLVVERESRRIVLCNKAFERVFGYSADSVHGRTTEFLYPTRQSFLRAGEYSRTGMGDGETARGDCLMRTADGTLIPTRHSVSPITDAEGRVVAAVSVIQDRRPWHDAERQLAESNQRLAAVFANLPGALCRLDLQADGEPRAASFEGALATTLLGEAPQSAGAGFLDCLDAAERSALRHSLNLSAATGRPVDLAIPARTLTDGRTVWLRLVSHPTRRNDDSTFWDAILLDVTREKAAEENLRHLANHDSLTGLPNRSLFRQRLEEALRTATGPDTLVGVVAINLDRFKYVNNAMGIGAGDQLLVEVARRLQALVGSLGTVARTGSDDFMLLVTHGTAPGGLQPLLQRLSHSLRAPFVVGQEVLYLSSSMGIARSPDDADDAEDLMVSADTALQRARSQGPGSYAFYDAGMTDSVVATATLESDLHHAVKHREIEVHYQPKVNPHTFEVVGLEALARWHHPERGDISPADFIPLAEETGLIHAIGEQVLYTACAQLKEWERRGLLHAPISINLSGRQLTEATSLQLQSILRETGLDPHYVELEITESALVTDTEQARRMLKALTASGVGIALDDFGKGYSSLSYLRRFPINTLKIDRSFVERIETNPSQSDLVGAIVAMARSLHMTVVAEGVETNSQLRALREHGVDAIQGWYFSPALSAEDIEPLLEAGQIQPTGTAS